MFTNLGRVGDFDVGELSARIDSSGLLDGSM